MRYLLPSLLLILSSCGSSYHYYTPPVTNVCSANKNEFRFSGTAGNTGSALNAGFALSERTGISTTYNYSSPLNYLGSELETALVLGSRDSSYPNARVAVGCGFGNNYEKTSSAFKNFRGEIVKPFLQFTFGSANNTHSIGNFIFVDGAFSVKLNYLFYNGYKATTLNNLPTEKKFNSEVFFAQPYFNFNLGMKWFRLSMGLGAILKKKYAFDKNLAIFPLEANTGFVFILGRKKDFHDTSY